MADTSRKQAKKHICAGLLAHVDAGKTTLSEAMLYCTGQIRSLGRVDHQDAYLDNDVQERERGITIFSKQARIETGEYCITLLDTPGHVDFSAEMERTLQVLDYAILVISGTDGVQGHTRTLWRLLTHYQVPTFLFINKMDLDGADREKLDQELKQELSDGCIDFSPERVRAAEEGQNAAFYEELAVCKEEILSAYLEQGEVSGEAIREAIRERLVFPCFYGSALKAEGVDALLGGLATYTAEPEYGKEFSARVYKIGRDPKGIRLTFLKLTGGELKVRDKVEYRIEGDMEASEEAEEDHTRLEKIDQIRVYSGEKYESVESLRAGAVCAVTGLTETFPGQGLGTEENTNVPVLEPVLNYRIFLPKEVNPIEMLGKLKLLEEEDPQLHIVWEEQLQEIHAQMMGQIQIEVLTRLIQDRFSVTVTFGPGRILYRETIAKPVEGIGHFEPLRHYAEVHILMEPGEPGSGIQVTSAVNEDLLDLNWQRLIMTHVEEKEHRGVLTGSPLTDVKCTVVAGRAHQKHTVGGDFRQATYRAIRHGLKSTESVLLEPYYAFSLEVPMWDVGRAMLDLTQRFAKFSSPEYVQGAGGEMARIGGTAPVSTLQDYTKEVISYTKGIGHLTVEVSGYDVCHNSLEVIERIGYDSEADLKNPTGSVFCAHGGGFLVPWYEVERYMHLDHAWHPQTGIDPAVTEGRAYDTQGQTFGADSTPGGRNATWAQTVASMTESEIDAELQDVYAREFGLNKEDLEEESRRKWRKKTENAKPKATVKYDKKGQPIYPAKKKQEDYLIVDGYNIIFAWNELKELARKNIDAARDRLKDILCDYQGYANCHLLVVFDAYRVKGNSGRHEFYDGKSHKAVRETEIGKRQGIEVVYTRQDETADVYIERFVHQIREKYQVTVATSDGLEQLTVLGQGASRMPAKLLKEEIGRIQKEAYAQYRDTQPPEGSRNTMEEQIRAAMESTEK